MSDQIETIARAFAAIIREAASELDIENGQTVGTIVLDINTRNLTYGPACATHDFFDANIGMAEAFFSATGREPATITEGATDSEKDADADLWNAAWTMAREAGFWLNEA